MTAYPPGIAAGFLQEAGVAWEVFLVMEERERNILLDRLRIHAADRETLRMNVYADRAHAAQLSRGDYRDAIQKALKGDPGSNIFDNEEDGVPIFFPGRTSEAATKYVGIINQGTTCYINSLIQMLYHLPAFRNAIYLLDSQDNSILLALRSLFIQLEYRMSPIETVQLTEAFGWSNDDASVQHDAHELAQKIFDLLEELSKGTAYEDFIKRLFFGELMYTSKSIDSKDVSCRQEGFYDIELVVKGMRNIYDSLDLLAAPERIEGVKFDHSDGTQSTHDVDRSLQITKLPPILLVHPNRADFCMETFERTIVPSKWDFSKELNLGKYFRKGDPTLEVGYSKSAQRDREVACTTYTLHSIIIHSGLATGGHYYSYVLLNDHWLCFNDCLVHEVSTEEVQSMAFGGMVKDLIGYDTQSHNRASLIAYIRDDCFADIMQEKEVPKGLQDEICKQLREWRTKEVAEKKVLFEFRIIDDALVAELTGNVYGTNETRSIEVLESATVHEVHRAIADAVGHAQRRITIWHLTETSNAFGVSIVAQLHTSVTQRTNNLVYVLTDEQVGRMGIRCDENVDSSSSSSALASTVFDISGEEPLLVFVKKWSSEDGGVLRDSGVVVTRQELRERFSSLRPPTLSPLSFDAPASDVRNISHEWHVAVVRDSPATAYVASIDTVPSYSYLVFYPSWLTKVELQSLVRAPLSLKVELRVLSQTDTTRWVALSTVQLALNATYSMIQAKAFDCVRAAVAESNASVTALLPRSQHPRTSEYIGIRVHDRYRNAAMDALVSKMCVCEYGNCESRENTLQNIVRNDYSSASRVCRVLYVEVLPAPLHDLRLDINIVFDAGLGVHRNVFVDKSTYNLGNLFDIAVAQLGPLVPHDLRTSIETRRRAGQPALRLVRMTECGIPDGDIFNEEEMVRLPSCTSATLLVDVLPEYSSRDRLLSVVFCDRTSGERYFGYPTTIVSTSPADETSEVLLERVAEKLRVPGATKTQDKNQRPWIMAVHTMSGNTFTMSRSETLKKILDKAHDEIKYLIVDRPEILSLDSAANGKSRNREQGITLRVASTANLADKDNDNPCHTTSSL